MWIIYPTNTTITFNPGDTDKQVQVPIINNNIPEGYRTVIFALTNAVNTLLYSPSNATLTIIDTVNAPGQLCFSATNYMVNETDGTAYLTVLRTNGTSGTVSVTCNTIAGHGACRESVTSPPAAPLTFNNGDTSKTFAVPLVQNNLVLGTVNFSVVLSKFDQRRGAHCSHQRHREHFGQKHRLCLCRRDQYHQRDRRFRRRERLAHRRHQHAVQVNYATVNGTAVNRVNYQSQGGTLGFAIGESLRSIQVPLIYDPHVTGDLNFTIVLSNPSVGTLIAAPGTNTVCGAGCRCGIEFHQFRHQRVEERRQRCHHGRLLQYRRRTGGRVFQRSADNDAFVRAILDLQRHGHGGD